MVNMKVFTQKLNPITGCNEWVVQSENYDYYQEVARSSFADMLHDTERNQLYEEALKAAIDKIHLSGRRATVLDIGTGTGLLSMMAARNGADSITACEAFKPMSDCAMKLIKLNGFENKIKVIPKRSTELTVGEDGDLNNKCNILVTEVFDTELIGEGALSTFKHAHEELLELDCIVIPDSATIYAQVVECPKVQNWNKLRETYNDDGELLLRIPKRIGDCNGSVAVHDVQLSQLPMHYINTIVPAVAVFHFDWSGKTQLIFQRTNVVNVPAEQNGIAQAVFMWWELKMDSAHKITLSCGPYWAHPLGIKTSSEIPWRDHWMQAIYYLPNEIAVKKGEDISLIASHDEYSLWFDLQKKAIISSEDILQPICRCGFHVLFSRTRIGQINDGKRSKAYISMLKKNITSDSTILAIGDCFYTSLIAAKLGAKKLYLIESNSISRQIMTEFIEYNKLDNVVLLGDPKQLDGLVPPKFIDFVIAEPYFLTSILPWDNLTFYHVLKHVQPYLSEQVKVTPTTVIFKGIAVQFSNLHKIRTPLGKCEGFIMTEFDKLIEEASKISDDVVEAQPLWEYPGIAVSNVEEILKLELLNVSNKPLELQGSFNIQSGESCNGVALWVEWVHDGQVISTGPTSPTQIGENIIWDMHTRQGVCLFAYPKSEMVAYTIKFHLNEGHFSFKCR